MSKEFLTVNYSQNSLKTLNSPSCKSVDAFRNSFNQDQQSEVRQLKEKVHKSFMQVMQMQSLHQQEIELLRKQYYEEQRKFKRRQAQLQMKLRTYENQQGVNKKFVMQLPNVSFTIDNIESIENRSNEDSRLQDSSILYMKELLSQKDSACQQKIKSLQIEIKKELMLAIQKGNPDEITKGIVGKVFSILSEIASQNCILKQRLDDSNRNIQLLQNNLKKTNFQYESAQKQIQFLSQHVKKIHNDKISFQRRTAELQRNKRSLQDSIRGFKKVLNANNISANQTQLSLRRQNSELLNCMNQGLNLSDNTKSSIMLGGSAKFLRMSSQNGFGIQKGFNPSSSIKNFRKKEGNYKFK